MKTIVFWDVALYNLVETDPDDGGSKHLWNINQFLLDYVVQHPRKHSLSTIKLFMLQSVSGFETQRNVLSCYIAVVNVRGKPVLLKEVNFLAF
jgi:hypothetical protein